MEFQEGRREFEEVKVLRVSMKVRWNSKREGLTIVVLLFKLDESNFFCNKYCSKLFTTTKALHEMLMISSQ